MNTPSKDTTTLVRRTAYYPETPTKLGQGDRPTTTISTLEPRRLDGYYPGKQGENPTSTQAPNSKSGGKWSKKGGKRRYKKGGKWSMKYKRSINCRRPKGFSQKQHCKYGRRSRRR